MNSKKGFTLIEILVVVAIIGILASIVIVGLGGARRSGQDAKRSAEVRQVQAALELYFNACGVYPDNTYLGGTDQFLNYEELELELVTPAAPNCSGADIGVDRIPHDVRAAVEGDPGDYGYESDGISYVLVAYLDGPLPQGYDAPAPPFTLAFINCVAPFVYGTPPRELNPFCIAY